MIHVEMDLDVSNDMAIVYSYNRMILLAKVYTTCNNDNSSKFFSIIHVCT